MLERQWEPLEDCLDALIDYRGKTPEKTTSGVPLITAKIVKGGVIERPTEFIAHEAYSAWMRRGIPLAGDVLLTTEAPLGEVAQLKSANVALAQRIILLRGKTGFLHNGYLKYFFLTDEGRRGLEARASGTTVLGIKQSELRRVEIPIIPFQEQTEIADTLQSLDDKIALLRETNATLEAIAQALFKSWFVDFDPVRAKAEGRDPEGMTPEVADLFPSEFEDSELGAIPKGWRVAPLEEHLDVVRGLSYKGSGLTDSDDPEGVPMHNLNSVLEGGGYKYAGLKFYKGEFKQKHEIKPGDIIVANTEQGHKHLLIGFPAVVPITGRRSGLYSHHLYRVRTLPHSPLGQLFLFRLLLVPAVREQVIGCSNGTTVNMLKADGLAMPRFVCPPRLLVEAYERVAGPIQARQEQNVATAENLASLRDTLLPRLMSGKLRLEALAMNCEGDP